MIHWLIHRLWQGHNWKLIGVQGCDHYACCTSNSHSHFLYQCSTCLTYKQKTHLGRWKLKEEDGISKAIAYMEKGL